VRREERPKVESREERFQGLYEAGRARVVAYALRRTPNAEDAADVVAETFAIAWRRVEVIPFGEREIPWLYAVARRVIANRVRRSSSQNAAVKALARELSASSHVTDEPGSERLIALGALDQLSDEDREVLMLVAWEGLSSRELGWALGCSTTAARIRLHRSRARLTQAWDEVRAAQADPTLQEVTEP
jgi:RNA polymerase sigma-70 factor (ECF subfamily)